MSLSQQQNDAITQILKDFYNQFLLNVANNAYIIKCKSLKGKEQLETFQCEIIQTLNQSTKERFAQTKSGIFSFISHQQTAKLTEVAFKNIFDKYFIPLSLQSQYRSKPNDMVLQMGLILITGNIKQLFQSSSIPALFLKQAKKDSIDSDFFLKYISPIIEQVPAVLHSQLLGTEPPTLPKPESLQQKEYKTNCNCKRYKQQINIQQQVIKLLESKNKILQEQVDRNPFSDIKTNMQSRQLSNVKQSNNQLSTPQLYSKGQSQVNIQLPASTSKKQDSINIQRQTLINDTNTQSRHIIKEESKTSTETEEEGSNGTEGEGSEDDMSEEEEFEVGSANDEQLDQLDLNQGIFGI